MMITALGTGLYWLVLLSLVPLVYSYKEYKLSGRHEKSVKAAEKAREEENNEFYSDDDGWYTDPIYSDINPANLWNTPFDD